MAIEFFRLTRQGREQLILVKRYTGEKQWNVLCRWAFCLSLRDPTPPPAVRNAQYSNVEISWKVFGGPLHAVYLALLKERCHQDGVGTSDDVLATQFKQHLNRGIGMLAGNRALREAGGMLNLLDI